MKSLHYKEGITPFCGFPKEFVDFLFSLQINNTVDMLPENKQTYRRLITEPLTLLFHALAQPALSVSESLVTKPSKCISTMYSDMRFSRSKPLKGYMYIRFREPYNEKDVLGLYFDMGFDYYSYGIRIYKQTSAGMERIREYAVDNSDAFTAELENIYKIGMVIIGDNFAKDRYPEINNKTLKTLINKKGFYIGLNRPVDESVFDGQLKDEVADAYASLKGLYKLFKNAICRP